MEIPKKLNVLGYKYKVEVSDDIIHKTEDNEVGVCYAQRQLIWVQDSQADDARRSTFLHELIEAVNIYMKIGLEHKQIEQLETGLFQVLEGNKLW